MKNTNYKETARNIFAKFLKETNDVLIAKTKASDYCNVIINEIEQIEDSESVVGFYLIVRHEISKIDTPF